MSIEILSLIDWSISYIAGHKYSFRKTNVFQSHISSSVDFNMNALTELISERRKVLVCLNNFKSYKQIIILKRGEEKWWCENRSIYKSFT